MPTQPAPAPAAPAPVAQPTDTPPAGGRWTWDAATGWTRLPDATAPAAADPKTATE